MQSEVSHFNLVKEATFIENTEFSLFQKCYYFVVRHNDELFQSKVTNDSRLTLRVLYKGSLNDLK